MHLLFLGCKHPLGIVFLIGNRYNMCKEDSSKA